MSTIRGTVGSLRKFAVRDAILLFLKLNLWLCIAALVMVVISLFVLSVPLSAVGLSVLLPPLVFYFIYVEDRRSISSEDWLNHPLRTRLVQRYQRHLLFTEVVALVGYEMLLLVVILTNPRGGFLLFLYGQLPFAVLAVYDALKQHPTFDSLAVGGTWAFIIVFPVVISTAGKFSAELAVVFLAWFVIVFAGVESRNLDDAEGDAEMDKTTLAGYLGEKPTKAMEGTLKTVGIAIFWHLAGPLAAAMVVGHLLLLRLFRYITAMQADKPRI